MARLFICITLIIGVVTIVACSSAVAQPTATTQPTATAQPTATTQPTSTARPTATTQPTITPVPPTATIQATTTPVPPTVTAQPTKASATPTPQASSSGQQKLNMDDYMPKGTGRDLVLRDCTTCHSIVPIITGQRPNARWLSLKQDHRDKASGVNQADYDAEFNYLMENFNNTKPEPQLPAWFIQQQPGVGE